MIDATHSAIMKRSDLEEIPYSDSEYIATNVHLSDNSTTSSGKCKFLPALLATLIACLGPFNFGFTLGYSSPIEEKIEKTSSHPYLTREEFSWFGALIGIGAIGGALIGGWAIEYFGRKTALMLYSVPFAAGWLMISNAHYPWMLFMGRILTGLAVGATSLTVPVYIAEIAHSDHRGGLGSVNQLAVTLGVFIAYIVGSECTWQTTALIALGPVTLLLLLMLFMPETPRWLLANNQRFVALKELTWLRGRNYDVEEECFEIESNLDMQEKMSLREFVNPSLRKPLIIGCFMMIFQQLCGVNAYIFYAEQIFQQAGIKDPDTVAICFSVSQFVATGIACLVVDRAGRRILLLIGSFGMCICNICIGVYYDIAKLPNGSNGPNSTSITDSLGSPYHSISPGQISWLAISSAMVFIILFSLGWGPLPWLLMSEVFPPRAKGPASSICTLINWLFVFIVTKNFVGMKEAFTVQGTFWFFAGWCLLSFIFVYFYVPETKGKTLEDIEHYFTEGKYQNENN